MCKLSDMIDVAIEATKAGGALAYRYFKSQPKVSYKPDNTPVTAADIEAEKLIRRMITKNFPDHGIISEELDQINSNARLKWIIDPIDGTKEFVRGIPFWATFLAVLEQQKPIIGIAFFPATNELFVAQKGKGTRLNGQKTKVSKITDLNLAFVNHGAISNFAKIGKLQEIAKLCQKVQGHRGFATFSLNLILKGKIDIDLKPAGSIWDFAAPSILVEEAGGKFTDFEGKFSLTSGNGISTNGLLHKQVISLLNDK